MSEYKRYKNNIIELMDLKFRYKVTIRYTVDYAKYSYIDKKYLESNAEGIITDEDDIDLVFNKLVQICPEECLDIFDDAKIEQKVKNAVRIMFDGETKKSKAAYLTLGTQYREIVNNYILQNNNRDKVEYRVWLKKETEPK